MAGGVFDVIITVIGFQSCELPSAYAGEYASLLFKKSLQVYRYALHQSCFLDFLFVLLYK